MKKNNKDIIADTVNYIVSKKDSLTDLDLDDKTVLKYRRLMAEKGVECTPEEVKSYIILIRMMLGKQ